jgi:hypothetical protein
MYFDISTYITHLHRDSIEWVVYISAKQLPHDAFALEYNSSLLLLVHEQHHDRFLHTSNNDSSETGVRGCPLAVIMVLALVI